MQKQITFQGEAISYTLRKSRRARHVRLAVHRDGSVVLTTPVRMPALAGEDCSAPRAVAY